MEGDRAGTAAEAVPQRAMPVGTAARPSASTGALGSPRREVRVVSKSQSSNPAAELNEELGPL
eukprot:4639567-Amphidinium_carterae.1